MQATASTPSRSSADRRILFVALGLGALAFVLTLAYLRSIETVSQTVVPTVAVVIAKEDIAPGTKITPAMVELRALPQPAVAAEVATSLEQVNGQTVRYPIARGEQIASIRLVPPARAQTLSFQIPEGQRGFTIPVQIDRSPAGLLAPGDYVDVLAILDSSELGGAPAVTNERGREVSTPGVATVLQNVQVLAVQRTYVETGVPYDTSVRGAPPKEGNVGYVTMAVTPEEAQALTLVQAQARSMTLTLRPFGDNNSRELPPALQLGALNSVRANPPGSGR